MGASRWIALAKECLSAEEIALMPICGVVLENFYKQHINQIGRGAEEVTNA